MSKNAKHTPKPWIILYSGFVQTKDGVRICLVNTSNKNVEEVIANKALIRAAPDMLEAIEGFIYGVETNENNLLIAYENAKQIIKKAKGIY